MAILLNIVKTEKNSAQLLTVVDYVMWSIEKDVTCSSVPFWTSMGVFLMAQGGRAGI